VSIVDLYLSLWPQRCSSWVGLTPIHIYDIPMQPRSSKTSVGCRIVRSYVPHSHPSELRLCSGSFFWISWPGSSFCYGNARKNVLGWQILVGLHEPGRVENKTKFYV